MVTERAVLNRLSLFPMPEEEERLWQMDTQMNAYGVRVDQGLIEGALHVDYISTQKLTGEAVRLTGLQNPNSTPQLLQWFKENGAGVENLQKETVAMLLKGQPAGPVRRMLEIRQQLGKTSIKKYVAMEEARCGDGRVRGLTQYYGANRTGRWAGRLVQMQNLPRNYLKTLDRRQRITKGCGFFTGMCRTRSHSSSGLRSSRQRAINLS